MPKARQDVGERFWKKVDRSSGGDGCWEWTASRFKRSGYGQFGDNDGEVVAHRGCWKLVQGPIPDGVHVLHKCDNRGCVNPAHLFLGSHADNMRDKTQKGRCPAGDTHGRRRHPEAYSGVRGETHGRAKLTAEQVAEIRQRYHAERPKQEDLGKQYGVSQTTIWRIVNGLGWEQPT